MSYCGGARLAGRDSVLVSACEGWTSRRRRWV